MKSISDKHKREDLFKNLKVEMYELKRLEVNDTDSLNESSDSAEEIVSQPKKPKLGIDFLESDDDEENLFQEPED